MTSAAALPARLIWEYATDPPRQRRPMAPALLVPPVVNDPPRQDRLRRLAPLAFWPQQSTGLTIGRQLLHVARPHQAVDLRARLAQMLPDVEEMGVAEGLLAQVLLDIWQAFAAQEVSQAQAGGGYNPVITVIFPTLPSGFRWMTTRADLAGHLPFEVEPVIARLGEGGVGPITLDMDEDTRTMRLGNASFTFVNPGPAGPALAFSQLMDSFEGQPFAQVQVVVSIGFDGMATGAEYTLFDGIVDRWQITQRSIQVSAIPKTLQEVRPISLTVRELIARVKYATGVHPFPSIPDEALEAVIPLCLGKAKAVPLIPVGNNTYLSGFGVSTINAVRDNGELLVHYPGDPGLVFGYPTLTTLFVQDHFVRVIKLLYAVEDGHTVSIDVNDWSGPFYFASDSTWSGTMHAASTDATPRVRHNLLSNGGFELGNLSGFTVATGDAVAEVVTFATGTGKSHDGYHTLRVRSTNLTESGEHRYTATVSITPLTLGAEQAVHLSFWYTAGTFLLPGDPPDAQVSSQLSVQVNGTDWVVLPGSPGFDAMAEFSATFVPVGGVVTLALRCEGLTELKSADIYLDDFVIWREEPVQPFIDDGVEPTQAMIDVLTDWVPGDPPLDVISFWAVRDQRAHWRFVSVIENALDAWGLVNTMARQLNAVITKDRNGRYRIDALDAVKDPVASFEPVGSIVRESFSRLSAPADNIYSSFFVNYAQDHGMVYVTPTETNLTGANAATMLNACTVRARGRGGDRQLRVESDLILDQFTATALLQAMFTRYGFSGDLLQWRSWLDAAPLLLLDQVVITHPVLPFGNPVQAELIGWHFLPDVIQVELVARQLPIALSPPDAVLAPIAKPIVMTTAAGVPVGVSALLYVIPAPTTTLDLLSILVTGLAPSGAGGFAVSVYGMIVFTPVAGFVGVATALYTIADTDGHVSNAATITITVSNPAQLVVANPDTATTLINTPVAFALLANDSATAPGILVPASVDLDPNIAGRQTTYLDAEHGTFSVDDLGTVTLTPQTGYLGEVVAYYLVQDDLGRTSNLAKITVTVEEEEEEPALSQSCSFVFGNDIDDPDVDGGFDTGIHIINAFAYFPEVDTAMACSGDPSLVGGTGAVAGVGFNDVYTSSRLGVAVMNPYTSFLGTIDITANGHGTTAMVAMHAYDGLLYVAMNTSLVSDQTVNGPPVIFTVANITDLAEDDFYDTWVEAQEFATTFIRVGAMAEHNGNLYVALEPKLPGTNALAIWQFNGTSWSLQHSFGTSVSRLRAFVGVGSFLYAGIDGELWQATAGVWALAQTFTGAVDSLSFKDGLIYVNVRNGSTREIWRGSSDDNVFTLFHTFTGETGTLVGPMATGAPPPDAPEGMLYVPVVEADGTKVYRWDGEAWTLDHNYGTGFLGVSAMQLMNNVLFLALARRLHTSDPGGGNVPGCEIWGVECYEPPTWDLFYDVAIVDFTSLITAEVIPAPPDATWDVTTLSLDVLVFPELDLTMSVGVDGVITGERTDTSYGGPFTTTYRCDDSLGRHWAGTFEITFIAG